MQVAPHQKQGAVSPCIPDKAPPPPPPLRDLSPAAGWAAPRYGGATLGGRPPAVSRQAQRCRVPAPLGPFPSYLLSRQAIHSAEEEEWAACAATMLARGARCPRLQRPPAPTLPLGPPPLARLATSRLRQTALSWPALLQVGWREGT